jgi:hypothetical protein
MCSTRQNTPWLTSARLQLEAWLGRWRAELAPTHSFVFTRANGTPLTTQSVHRLFTSTCYRLVSARCAHHGLRPHQLVKLRDNQQGARERQ